MDLKFKLCVIFLITSIVSNSNASVNSPDPVIINTVAQHYENPTLDQYTQCSKSREICLNDCRLIDENCRSKCQVCPILIEQDILVQGINDTLYRMPITTSKINQTNIIRLTNDIRNIIRTSLGNITAHNTNNITVYQKTSKSGGKFGLGYNEKGPCCHLIEPQKCRNSPNGLICSHRRQQTCGSHCISRVMRAKRVVTCSETDPDNCQQSIEYLPQPRRPGCQYTSKWPFISCRSSNHKQPICARCYQIPYLNIIRGNVPRACLYCFGRPNQHIFSSSYPESYYNGGYGINGPIGFYPSYQSQSFMQPQPMLPGLESNLVSSLSDTESNEMPFSLDIESDFKLEDEKCINEDGTVVENCNESDSPLHFNFETDLKNDNRDEVSDNESNEDEVSNGYLHRRIRKY